MPELRYHLAMRRAVLPRSIVKRMGERASCVSGSGRIKLVLRLVLATVWAGLMVVAGIAAVRLRLPETIPLARLAPVAGFTAIAAGQVVFSALVCDRLCPHADTRLTGAVQLVSGVALTGGLVTMFIVWLTAGS